MIYFKFNMATFGGNTFRCSHCGRELDWYEYCNCRDEKIN